MMAMSDQTTGPNPPFLHDKNLIAGIELLFYAYRDFTGDPDEALRSYGFGRAHHRVVHFVARNPGISVTELLAILKITKQSLSRVLSQLVEEDFVRQEKGAQDRRRRLLYLTARAMRCSRNWSDCSANGLPVPTVRRGAKPSPVMSRC